LLLKQYFIFEEAIMDSITVVTRQGYFQRLKNSVLGVLFGLGLFFVSFYLLWWNEGDLAAEKGALKELQAAVVEADAGVVSPSTEGKPVHIIGDLTSGEELGDPEFIVPGPYLRLDRKAEMYQWVEEERSETRERVGGSSETVKTYTYRKEWREGRKNSSAFHSPAGHENPNPTIQSRGFAVQSAQFGSWDGRSVIDQLSASESLPLEPSILPPSVQSQQQGKFLYFRRNSSGSTDEVGDERVSFTVLRPATYSVVAQHERGARLAAWVSANGKEKFLVGAGTKSTQQLISDEQSRVGLIAWFLRALGFLMMWGGLGLILRPIATLLAILPPAAAVGRFAIGSVTFLVAAVLSLVTIVVAWVAHNPIMLVIVIGGGLAWALWLIRKRFQRASGVQPAFATGSGMPPPPPPR
jgi:hypothetical protein